MFTVDWFNELDARLRAMGLDSDVQSFDEIRENLQCPRRSTPDAFAAHCAYVILAGGFSQKTARRMHGLIMDALGRGADAVGLFNIFHNINKTRAIYNIWTRRCALCAAYYALTGTEARVGFLATLPHIGRITAHHLARNLGEDIVKYDIWIQRLGALYARNPALEEKINNAKLDADVQAACDAMFDDLVKHTGLPRGYIDVVLWRAAQNKLIDLEGLY